MIDAKRSQDRSVHVADVDRIFDDIVGEVISLTVYDAWFDSSSGHPHGVAARMMIAAVVLF